MIAECRLSINGLPIDGLSIGVRLPACGGELQRSNPQSALGSLESALGSLESAVGNLESALGNLQSLIGNRQSPIGNRAWVS
jgi:hypothetical protein